MHLRRNASCAILEMSELCSYVTVKAKSDLSKCPASLHWVTQYLVARQVREMEKRRYDVASVTDTRVEMRRDSMHPASQA